MLFFPAIDILDGQAVRLAQGSYDEVTRYNPDPVAQAVEFERLGANWIHVVDLDGARTGVTENDAVIRRILEQTSLGIEVGGGLRTLEVLERYVAAGASRLVLGTKLATDPAFVAEAVEAFGDYLVAGIDARDGSVAISGWEDDARIDARELVGRLGDMGLRHLVFTDISNDGMQTGIDVDLYVELAGIAGFPVVASGGVSSIDDIRALAAAGDAIEGVIAGRAVYEGALDVVEALAVCAEGGASC